MMYSCKTFHYYNNCTEILSVNMKIIARVEILTTFNIIYVYKYVSLYYEQWMDGWMNGWNKFYLI